MAVADEAEGWAEAQRRIAACREARSESLALSNLGLTRVSARCSIARACSATTLSSARAGRSKPYMRCETANPRRSRISSVMAGASAAPISPSGSGKSIALRSRSCFSASCRMRDLLHYRRGDKNVEAEYIAPDLLPARNDPAIAEQLRQKWEAATPSCGRSPCRARGFPANGSKAGHDNPLYPGKLPDDLLEEVFIVLGRLGRVQHDAATRPPRRKLSSMMISSVLKVQPPIRPLAATPAHVESRRDHQMRAHGWSQP
jgi:hypothetical protein